jgi:hypothetical protein
MRRSPSTRKAKRRAAPGKVARLYHFDAQTVGEIEFLAQVFGGKEKGIAAAVAIAARVLKGEQADLHITVK